MAQAPSPEKQQEAEGLASKAFEAYSKADYTTALTLYQQALLAAPAAAIYFNIANIYDKKLPDATLAVEFYRKCVAAPDATPDLTIKATARIQALQQAAAPKGPVKPEAPPVDEDPGRGLRIGGGVALGLGAVGLGAGFTFGAIAKSKADSAKKVCNAGTCSTQQGVDDMRSASSAANVSTALVVVGAAAAVTGTVLLIVAPRSGARPAAALTISPSFGPTQVGLTLSGAFF
jgi:hypothetical protein